MVAMLYGVVVIKLKDYSSLVYRSLGHCSESVILTRRS